MDKTIDNRQSIRISDDIRIIVDIEDGWAQILDESEGTQVMLSALEAKELCRKLAGVLLVTHIQKSTSFEELFSFKDLLNG